MYVCGYAYMVILIIIISYRIITRDMQCFHYHHLQSSSSSRSGKRVCVPLCGGNIDPVTLGRVIDRGLAASGRMARFTATVS
jgi:threonine dehydratase